MEAMGIGEAADQMVGKRELLPQTTPKTASKGQTAPKQDQDGPGMEP